MSHMIHTRDLVWLRSLRLRIEVARNKARSQRRKDCFHVALNHLEALIGYLKETRRANRD